MREPLAKRIDKRLSSSILTLSHVGSSLKASRTLVSTSLASSCFNEIKRMFLSLKKSIVHKEYAATRVEIPICRDFKMMLN